MGKKDEFDFTEHENLLSEMKEIQEFSKTDPIGSLHKLADIGEKILGIFTKDTGEKKWEDEYDAELLLANLQKYPRDKIGEICTYIQDCIKVKTEYILTVESGLDVYWDGMFEDPEVSITSDVFESGGFGNEKQDEFPSETTVTCMRCDNKEIITKKYHTLDNKESDWSYGRDKVPRHFLLYLVAHYFNVHYFKQEKK